MYLQGLIERTVMKGSSDEVEAESEVSDVSMDNDEVDLAQLPVKYLIFTTGSKTYTPHQIGKKLGILSLTFASNK